MFPISFWVKTKACLITHKALGDLTPLTSLLLSLTSSYLLCWPLCSSDTSLLWSLGSTRHALSWQPSPLCHVNMFFFQISVQLGPLALSGLNSNVTLVGLSLITLLKTATIPTLYPPEFLFPPPHFIFLRSLCHHITHQLFYCVCLWSFPFSRMEAPWGLGVFTVLLPVVSPA